jgi:hypothetical protein
LNSSKCATAERYTVQPKQHKRCSDSLQTFIFPCSLLYIRGL